MRKRRYILRDIKENSKDIIKQKELLKEWIDSMLKNAKKSNKKHFNNETIDLYNKYLIKTIELETNIILRK